jgi:hypothetical protein
VGSDREAIGKLLESRPPASADVALDRQSGTMRVTVSGRPEGEAEVRLYEFDRRRVTRIGGGENKGKTLTNHHVVRKTRRLGLWAGGSREYLVESLYLNEDEGCAVVVQRRDQGAVLGAASCRP